MTHQPTIAITGVTGKIGGAVATELQDLAPRLRLLVRNPSRAPRLEGQLAVADYSDAAASREALAGVNVLFMVSAGESPERVQQHEVFVDAAAAAGVKHIVYTSFLGAKPDATFTLARDHWYTEQHIRESGIAWTFLRDSFYLDFFPEVVDENGVIRGPAGNGRVGAVSREDVARSATAVLRNPAPHAGCAYDMTGPQALSLNDIARIIGEVWGKQVTYQDESLEEAYASRAHYGAPGWEVDAWVSTYTAIASGELDVISDSVQSLTGRPPLSLAELLHRG
ncbi:MAG: SDR family oxidoreductase [Propionibacterium sp.]|jgi:predicted nucleoside-diphosphate sugar epimerase|nr:SDR family oxidoreductase [Propionibacterium sp.]MBB1578042.1 SDR family oxidoreductase [Propionibacterium sp.]